MAPWTRSRLLLYILAISTTLLFSGAYHRSSSSSHHGPSFLYHKVEHDPEYPRSEYDNFVYPKWGSKPPSARNDDQVVQAAIIGGNWVMGDSISNTGIGEHHWGRNYTCRSGVKCVAKNGDKGLHIIEEADVVLTLSESPNWLTHINRTRTKLAFLGVEPYGYDVDMENVFDWKALVYKPETEEEKKQRIWVTYSETPGKRYLGERAQLDWTKKSRDRNVMFVSSNSCPHHRSELVKGLVEAGLDVWSLGSCSSEHETTDRVWKLKEYCGDTKSIHGKWRAPKECLTEQFKFIISIENTLANDYASEKFFHPFNVGTVPVYLGPPNIYDYAPGDKSFIDIREFQIQSEDDGEVQTDYKSLASYLNYLNEHDSEYEKFFNWKKKSALKSSFADVNYHSWENLACVLCDRYVEELGKR